jgi:F-type H+-transporting ATPase subunit b
MMRAVLLSFSLWATPAFAGDPPESPPPVSAEPGEGGGEHKSEHIDYLGDANHNGVADWRDPQAGEAYVISGLVQHAVNLAILVGVLLWFFRRPVADALANRAHDIQKDLGEAARLRADAEARHAELGARIQAFEQEFEKMKAQAAMEAKAEEARLIARSHEESARIAATAQRNIRDEVARARTALQGDAVELAMRLAENTLRNNVKSDDQQALARQFLESLNAGVPDGR